MLLTADLLREIERLEEHEQITHFLSSAQQSEAETQGSWAFTQKPP